MDAFRVLLPNGMDVNEYAQQVQPTAKSLGLAIRKAQWLGNGQAPRLTTVTDEHALPDTQAVAEPPKEPSPLAAANIEPAENPLPLAAQAPEPAVPSIATPQPEAPQTLEASVNDHEVNLALGDRQYRIRGLSKNLSYEQLKVNVLVSRGEHLHIDSFALLRLVPRLLKSI